jgi:hypothetical protein
MFSPEERLVFKYNVGGVARFADPLDIRRKLVRAGRGEIDRILEDAENSPDPMQAADAEEKRLAAVLDAFGLPPFDTATGQGTTEREALAILWEFLEYLEKNAKAPAS